MTLATITNDQLIALATQSAGTLRIEECRLLEILGEIDARKLYAERGYSSLFAFCTECLKFSEGTSARRVAAARACRKFPEVMEHLDRGRLHLTAVALMAPHLTPENLGTRVGEAIGKSHRQLQHLVETWKARQLALASPCGAWLDAVPRFVAHSLATASASVTPSTQGNVPLASTATVTMTAPEASHVPKGRLLKLRVSAEFDEKLERVRHLMTHVTPDGDVADLLEAAVDALLEKRDPMRRLARKAARHALRVPVDAPMSLRVPVDAPMSRRVPVNAPVSRRVPQAVRDAVWVRDEGRCTFVSADGHACDSQHGIQYDHIRPFALGGRSHDVANIRLLCATHNRWRAERTFGARPTANVGGTGPLGPRAERVVCCSP